MKLSIATPKSVYPWSGEICMGLYYAAKELGHNTEVTVVDTLDDYNRGDINLFLGAHWFSEKNKEGNVIFNKPKDAIWVWYQMEQIPHHDSITPVTEWRWDQTVRIKDNFDWILAESPPKVKFLQSQNIKSDLLLCGYHSSHEWKVPEINKEFDLIFIGAITPRRAKVLERVLNETKLSMFPMQPFISGKEKYFALKKSRIYLNIHMNDLKAFEKQRIIVEGLTNRNFVLSESIDHLEGFRVGEHLGMAPYDDLVDSLHHYVNHDEEREEIIRKGYDYVKKDYCIIPSLERVLGIVRDG
jgi:spore maturation protein CgeB